MFDLSLGPRLDLKVWFWCFGVSDVEVEFD